MTQTKRSPTAVGCNFLPLFVWFCDISVTCAMTCRLGGAPAPPSVHPSLSLILLSRPRASSARTPTYTPAVSPRYLIIKSASTAALSSASYGSALMTAAALLERSSFPVADVSRIWTILPFTTPNRRSVLARPPSTQCTVHISFKDSCVVKPSALSVRCHCSACTPPIFAVPSICSANRIRSIAFTQSKATTATGGRPSTDMCTSRIVLDSLLLVPLRIISSRAFAPIWWFPSEIRAMSQLGHSGVELLMCPGAPSTHCRG